MSNISKHAFVLLENKRWQHELRRQRSHAIECHQEACGAIDLRPHIGDLTIRIVAARGNVKLMEKKLEILLNESKGLAAEVAIEVASYTTRNNLTEEQEALIEWWANRKPTNTK